MTLTNPAPIERSEATLPSQHSELPPQPGAGVGGAGAGAAGSGSSAAPYGTPQSGDAIPPSVVADVDYPNVPDTTEPQQAATAPGAGGVVQEKLPFKEQASHAFRCSNLPFSSFIHLQFSPSCYVNGYAKKFAGTVFRNKDEKEFGEKKLQGEI